MCLSTVYKTSDPNTAVMEFVSKIKINGDQIILTDVMGDTKEITGRLVLADLTGAVVQIDCGEA